MGLPPPYTGPVPPSGWPPRRPAVGDRGTALFALASGSRAELFCLCLPGWHRAGRRLGLAAGRMVGFHLVARPGPTSPRPSGLPSNRRCPRGVGRRRHRRRPAGLSGRHPPAPPDSSPQSAPLESDCLLLILGELGSGRPGLLRHGPSRPSCLGPGFAVLAGASRSSGCAAAGACRFALVLGLALPDRSWSSWGRLGVWVSGCLSPACPVPVFSPLLGFSPGFGRGPIAVSFCELRLGRRAALTVGPLIGA